MNANNQDRNQAHYFSRSISSLLVLLLLSFIIIIAGSCKKNSEEKPEEEYILASVSKPVDQSGSTITLPQVATVFFDPNTFEKTVECKLYNSNKPATQDDLKLAAALFGMTELFNYEIRVNTGIIEPKKNVKIEINLTDEFINKVSGDLGIRGYAKLFVDDDNEKTENFESIVSKYYGSRKVVQLELDPSYFSNAWTSDNSFEAIISVGITPGINPSAGRTTIDCAGGSYISCPINTCSVASAFNPSRLHPITNRPTPHRGVDFHGATGTPVKAASDGEVIAAGYQFNETTKTGWPEIRNSLRPLR